MLNWIKKKIISAIVMVIGGTAGFLYWYFVGCATGTCPITSHWYTNTLYGMLLVWLIGDLIESLIRKKPVN